MSDWKKIESPKLRIPLEMREMAPGSGQRTWEVQELRGGAMFMVHLDEAVWRSQGRGAKHLPDAAAVHAVCLAVEEALLSPPDKEPGITYEISVGEAELLEAAQTAD